MAVVSPPSSRRPSLRPVSAIWVLPIALLCVAYALLGLTLSGTLSHEDIMERCVLVDANLGRIWSVAHIEIGMAYLGVFIGMAIYVVRAGTTDRTHLTDLGLGFAYLGASFLLDFLCVRFFHPFLALLIGDAVVMTFTLLVSRQLWFQRLLGVFVPMVFFTCGFGHFMEGLSYWRLTYPINVPWTMVTADIGFAILVNVARFPAFIRGQDIVNELDSAKAEAASRQKFYRDAMYSITNGRLNLCAVPEELPPPLPPIREPLPLRPETLREARVVVTQAADERGFPDEVKIDLQTAVGEAAMNAIVHGQGGILRLRGDGDTLQTWIEDQGAGIQFAHLPQATLERGWSSKNSLGQGFWLMLRTTDRLDLKTGSDGTTVVLTSHRVPKTHTDFLAA